MKEINSKLNQVIKEYEGKFQKMNKMIDDDALEISMFILYLFIMY